jgi:hypothetical protein
MTCLYTSRRNPAWVSSANLAEGDLPKMHTMVQETHADFILDLGTRLGGTTLMMHETRPMAVLWSFDTRNWGRDFGPVSDYHVKDEVTDEPQAQMEWFDLFLVRFFRMDFLEQAPAIKRGVHCYEYNRLFIFVDGFWKAKEATYYTDLMRPGDVMALHDVGQWDPEIVEREVFGEKFKRFKEDLRLALGFGDAIFWERMVD